MFFVMKHIFLDDRRFANLLRMKRNMLNEAEKLQLKALNVSLKAVGEKALLTAKSFCNLGRLYQSQEKYMVLIGVYNLEEVILIYLK